MASDEEDDIEALRQAALATLKKKPAVAEEAQPIPQLTSSGHSLHKSKSPWTEDFFDNVPFHDNDPVAQFQPDRPWEQQQQPPPPEYGQGSPTHYPDKPWQGRGSPGNFPPPFMRGHGPGPFLPNQRLPFGQNQRPPFGQRMPFNRHRPPFNQSHRMPFNRNQRPPFGQNPMQFTGGPPRGGGNLIVITAPDNGRQRFPGQRPLFPGGINNQGGPMAVGRGGVPGNAGRGGATGVPGQGGNVPPMESSSKPMLLRPQDKYCPSSDTTTVSKEPEKVHRKKKDKFSRYDSSGSDSDDESEDESEDERPARRVSLAGNGEEEEEAVALDSADKDQSPSAKDIPDTEISISVHNTSQIDSDKEMEEEVKSEQSETEDVGEAKEAAMVSEPELNEAEDSAIVFEPELNEAEESEAASEPELGEEEEERLLALSPSGDSPQEVRQNSVDREEPSPRNESPASQHSNHGEENSGSDGESGSDDSSASDNESDSSSSGSSASSSTSSKEAGSQSNGASDTEDSGQKNVSNSPEPKSLDSGTQDQHHASDSDSEKESIRRLPVKCRVSTSPRRRAPSPQKPEVMLSPEEQAKLEARRRKFQSGQEVQVTAAKRTISLKGIIPKTAKKPKTRKQSNVPVTNSTPAKAGERMVQARTAVARSAASDSHRKHSRRKVSIEGSANEKSSSSSEAENTSESEEEDDEEGGTRSWMRESNTSTVKRKTIQVDKPLPDSGSYRGNSFRGGSRNGGYQRLGYDSPRDVRPEVHYSSSEGEDMDSDRKLISVVVPRSSAGTHSRSKQSKDARDDVRTTRKRAADSAEVIQERDRASMPKSKNFQDFNSFGGDGQGTISVVITGDASPPKRSRSSGSRLPVHQRLGRGNKHHESGSTRRNIRQVARNKTESPSEDEEESNHNELDLRIRQIKKKNAAILRRQEEVRQDRELYG